MQAGRKGNTEQPGFPLWQTLSVTGASLPEVTKVQEKNES